MFRESNPHFLPRDDDPVIEHPSQTPSRRSNQPHPPNRNRHHSIDPRDDDPVIEYPSSQTPSRRSNQPPPPKRNRYPIIDPQHPPTQHGHSQPHPSSHPQDERGPQNPYSEYPPTHQGVAPPQPDHEFDTTSHSHGRHPPGRVPRRPHSKSPPPPPHQPEAPPQRDHEPRPHPTSRSRSPRPSGHGHRHRHGPLHFPKSRRTNPVAWLLAIFCALFWIIVIVGGLIILIVYLLFRPANPRFDISTATLNAAYLDLGYLLNADFTLLVNFTNPNTKVNIDFSYIVLDIYYENTFIATQYIDPFSVTRRESRFANVHLVSSQVRLSMGQSVDLQGQIGAGRVSFEVRGVFRTRSRLGGFFQYSYWLYAHCQITVTGPPTGVIIRKRCVTKR